MKNQTIKSVGGRLTKHTLAEWLARLFGHAKQQPAADEPSFRYVGRLGSEEIGDFIEKSLGRRLTQVEVAAFEEGFRPYGLLDPDDCYSIRLASPHYLGSFAPELDFFGTAVEGYADGEVQLKLAETVSIHYDDGVDEINDELVAQF